MPNDYDLNVMAQACGYLTPYANITDQKVRMRLMQMAIDVKRHAVLAHLISAVEDLGTTIWNK